MQLNKNICIKCTNKYKENVFDEKKWKCGTVRCPAEFITKCPLEAEHLKERTEKIWRT